MRIVLATVVALAAASAQAQQCVACGQCQADTLQCPNGSSVFINATCTPGGQIMTMTANGKTATCQCCNPSGCQSTAVATFCGGGGGGFGGGSGSSGLPTVTGVKAPPGNPVSGSNVFGPELGMPVFSRGPYTWGEDSANSIAARAAASRTQAGNSRASSQTRGLARDLGHQRRHRTPGCFTVATSAKASFFQSLPTLTQPTQWPPYDPLAPFKPAGTDEAQVAQPITGAGAHVAPPDRMPSPSPQSVNRATDCNKGWFFRSNGGGPTQGDCFYTAEQCQAANGGRDCGTPPVPDPALGTGHRAVDFRDCQPNWVFNSCNHGCYPSRAECQRFPPSNNGGCCP